MVALIYTGDAGDIVKGRKITDVIMPDREIDTLLEELMEPPEDPEVAPPDIAPPQMDVEPLAISAVSTKPQINFNSGSGTLFRDGEYIPLFKAVKRGIYSPSLNNGPEIIYFVLDPILLEVQMMGHL